uniref:T-cell surface glycoprotein CD8 alpha chain n=1 Tax=Leptobrachium leishanense TaxID=445787 RepID=A0A8C5M9Y1_9ANUR
MCSALIGDTMRGIIYMALILNLAPFSESNRLHLTKTSGNVQTGSSGPVNLECRPSGSGLMEQGVFWLRQKKDKTSPESILFISSANKPTVNDLPNSERYKGSKGSSAYELKINPVTESDHATYYCLIKLSSVLFISPGIQLYPPTAPTVMPKTTKAPVPTKPPQTQDPTKDQCGCTRDTEEKETPRRVMNCDLYIWTPLVGLCALLFIALLVTTVLLCKRTRRRYCRCKHVPLNQNNGKARPHGRVA